LGHVAILIEQCDQRVTIDVSATPIVSTARGESGDGHDRHCDSDELLHVLSLIRNGKPFGSRRRTVAGTLLTHHLPFGDQLSVVDEGSLRSS
jgi:hypothetical protein